MTTRLTEAPGVIRLELGGGMTAKLFGAPFLLVGLWLGHHLVEGILDLVAGRASAGEMAFGTVLLTLMTAAFLVPGWLLIASRAIVEIDRLKGVVTTTRDLRIYKHRQQAPLADFTRLVVDQLTTSANPRRRARPRHQVELADAGQRRVLVGLVDDGDEAVAFARRLGALVGLPVEDLRHVDEVA